MGVSKNFYKGMINHEWMLSLCEYSVTRRITGQTDRGL